MPDERVRIWHVDKVKAPVANQDEEGGRLTPRAAKPGPYYLTGGAQTPASAVWGVPVRLDRDRAVRLGGSNTTAASRAHDAN
jgi:hypothetical protein